MILTFICLSYLSHGERFYPNKPLSTFPKQIGDWVGKETHIDEKIIKLLGVSDIVSCSYSNDYGRQIDLYVGFYQSQREGELIHSPRNCMPGAGWNFVREGKVFMNAEASDKQSILVNNILLQKGDERQIMFYWFQGRGRYITSEYMQKIYLVIDSITKRRTDEAFVRLIAPVIDGDEQETIETLKSFTRHLIPLLQEYLPS
jgi:EpsI family protein